MAYTSAQLIAAYTAANNGVEPDAATTALLNAFAAQTQTGQMTDAAALSYVINSAQDDVQVAVQAYQFFTGAIPSAGGLDYLTNSDDNANDLNDAYYAQFNLENRYINFAANLGLNGEGADTFADTYGDLAFPAFVDVIYETIIGSSYAAAAGVNVDAAKADIAGRYQNFVALATERGLITATSTPEQIDLAVKASVVGYLMAEGVKADVGIYAAGANNFVLAAIDGNEQYGVDLLGTYSVLGGGNGQPPGSAPVGKSLSLTAGADAVTGGAGADTITALTVGPTGAAAETFSAFDVVDGGAGRDTLNIYTTGTENEAFPATATVKNVEVVNILNTGAAAAYGDASLFQGVQELWQHNAAAAVTNLGAQTTAGFKSVDANVSVTPAAGVASAAVALDTFGEGKTITVDGSAATSKLSSVTVSGTVKDTDANGAVAATTLAIETGKDVETLTVNTGVTTTLTVTENGASAGTKDVRTIDASGSAGNITFAGSVTGGTAGSVSTIRTGAGRDTVTIVTDTRKDDTATTTVDETVSALAETGAGNDALTINTTGTGTTTARAGDGNDTVTLTGRGSGKLTVELGAGNDSFKGAGTVSSTDSVDGGEGGLDTLALSMVGAANIGAFSNFEVFDAAGLAKALDVEILATKNTVTEFVASADVGAGATLTNVGAGVGYRVVGDTDVLNALTITQKTGGPLTVTLDIDETGATAATTAATDRDASVVASNATSVKAVFDSAFVGAATGAGDNTTDLNITGSAATSLEVVSGGANASNNLDFTGADNPAAGKGDLLTSVTITGDRAITFDYNEVQASEIASVNASGLTGALTFDTADLLQESVANAFDGGVLTLGSGADVITLAQGASIANIGRGPAENATAQGAFDVLVTGAAVAQAADAEVAGVLAIEDGKITFLGAGPATLSDAVALADANLGSGVAAVFEYLGNSYIFVGDDVGADIVVKLVGVTGLSGLDEVGTSDQLYVF